ncbi:mycofactocin precursor MftA [Nocardioides sp.]|nr:mycofactocin precursor MftA [Nocardioides sp.]MDP3894259.1 mycofactocin precursor MftA [Nocardioides sp.]
MTSPTDDLTPTGDPQAGLDHAVDLVEEISIDGMCGVY